MLRSPHSESYLRDRYDESACPPTIAAGSSESNDPGTRAAIDRQSGQHVTIRRAQATHFKPDETYRFQTEAEILSLIQCDSFLEPLDWGRDDEWLYCVRRYFSATSLRTVLANGSGQHGDGRLPLAQALSITCDVLDALKHIHLSGCVYRNVGSSKILTDGQRARLVCPGPEDYSDSNAGHRIDVLELAQFASPELSGSIEHDVGPSSDLYSMGVLMFTMLAGRPPFQGETIGAILFQHIANDPKLELLGDHVPAIVSEIIGRLLKKEPRDRYQSAAAALSDIAQVVGAIRDQRPLDQIVIGRQDTRDSIIEPAFVGRAAEMAKLEASLEQVAAGASQGISILCPSGIGKSRIVLETIRLATRKGFTVYRSLASNQASQIPTAPLLSIVDQLTTQVKHCERLRSRLRQELMEFHDEIATVFPELAQALDWPQASLPDRDALGKTRVETAFCQVFSGLGDGEKPVFIWIDDCQWLDSQSLAIVEKFQRAKSRNSLFVFSMRSDEGVSNAFCERVQIDLTIHLTVLGDDEVEALTESMAGRLPSEAVRTVVKLSAGSPFMASAILRGMAESGALYASAQGWQIDREKLVSIQASANAAEALLNRLQNMPPVVLRQLSIAAIIGKEFNEQTVVELSPVALKDSKACFELSRQQRLIWSMPNGSLTFVHDKIRETLIARLSPDERKQIHLSYAEHLKKLESDCSFELAYHYYSAESFGAALPYALQAAETARRLHSLDRAEELMRIALHGLVYADQKTRHEVHAGLADVLMLAGKYDEAEHWFEVSLQTVECPLDVARISLKRGELAFKRGDKENAVKLFSAALSELNEAVPSGGITLWVQLIREILTQTVHSLFPKIFLGTKRQVPSEARRLSWRLHSRIAHGYWYTKDKFHVLWAHLRGMNLSERYAPTPELAQAYSEHAPAMSLIPWHKRGIQYVQQSMKIRESFNDIWGQGQSRNFYSILLYSSSQFESCIDQASHAESILLRTGDYWEVNIARYQLAASLYRMGDLKAALDVARRTYESAASIGDYQSTGNIIDVWVRAAVCQMPDEVLAAEKTRTLRDRQGECQVLLAEGVQLFGKDQFGEAAKCFRKAIQTAEKAGVVNTFITPNYPWLATALRMEMETHSPKSQQTRRRAVREIYRSARRAVRVARSFQNELPHALREFGAACDLYGRTKRAKQALTESLVVATRQKADYELALTQVMYGAIGFEHGWSEAEQLDQSGSAKLQEIRRSIRQLGQHDSMSLLDRFDTLLEAGRQIISAASTRAIFDKTIDAAKRLLRGQRTLMLEAVEGEGRITWKPLDSDDRGFDPLLATQAYERNKTIISEHEQIEQNGQSIRHSGAFLCCPITVHGKISACVYVANEFLTGLFGNNEIRIADYLASAAGGALEKADGFQQLERLNISLEQKVVERTAVVEARSRELEITANELMSTQTKLELARDEAESANAAKSEFLARMSHEIRTPISAILGFTELMLRGIVKDPGEAVRKLETIHTNGSHLLQLINDLLDLSKIEADKMEVESIDCNPIRIMHDVVDTLQVRADEKSIGLEMRIDGDVPKQIKSDPTRLRQIITNLIGNAIKFTSQGRVVVTLRLVDDRASATSEVNGAARCQLEFEITDSGIGMTHLQLEKIFDPFTQADSTVTRKFGGTGLGLSISKQLAEALGGGISVASQPGSGSTFTVRVSAGFAADLELLDSQSAKQFLTQENKKQHYQANLSGCRILIVDDVETNRELLSLILKDAGAEVDLAVNGRDAIEFLVRDANVDLVLMDMQMPVLDGYSATKFLKEKGFAKPIIALTANTMNGDENKCLDAGCSDYLSKPIDINCLLQKVSTIHGVELIAADDVTSMKLEMRGKDPKSTNASPAIAAGSTSAIAHWTVELPADEPFRSFATEFVEKVESQYPELAVAVETKDFDEVARMAHWIKGTGGTVGLPRMTAIAAALESASRQGCVDSVHESLEQLRLFVGLTPPPICQ